jgi:PKHD-type hydroxylase
MLLELPDVLSEEDVKAIAGLLSEQQVLDGRASALGGAARVKNNLEIDSAAEETRAAQALLIERLSQHPLFDMAVHPRAFSQPIFSRYEGDMEYGFHLDAAIMRRGGLVRADVAVTIFLSDPSAYDGGELVIQTSYGESRYKAAAGACILYPASTFHRVSRVERGVRTVGVLWVQSMVRDPEKRRILYDLGCTIEYLDLFAAGNPEADRLRRCQLNLLRSWAEI